MPFARPIALFLAASISAWSAPAFSASALEKPRVTIGVGGQAFLQYLPLTIAQRRGYFKEEGLDVEISDFAGGAKALQSMVGGSSDLTAGSYDHVILMQAKKQPIVATVLMVRTVGLAVALLGNTRSSYNSPQDFRGLKIGVTAPGSSSFYLMQYLMVRNGVDPNSAAYIGVGAGATAISAAQRGQIDVIVNAEPVITRLEGMKITRIAYDGRTEAGTRAIYGGPYPTATIYATSSFVHDNSKTVQAVVNATLKALNWIRSSRPAEIADAVPQEWWQGDRKVYEDAVAAVKDQWSVDGKPALEGMQTVRNSLAEFNDEIKAMTMDYATTFDGRFVDAATRSSR